MAIYADTFKRGPNESWFEYMMRVNQNREGGMLGTYKSVVGTPDIPAPVETPTEETSQPLGQQVVRTVVQDEDNSNPQIESTPVSVGGLIRSKTGETFDPLGLMTLIPTYGKPLATGLDMSRDASIRKELEKLGYTEKQANIAVNDPEYLRQLLYASKFGPEDNSGYTPNVPQSTFGSIISGLFRKEIPDDVVTAYDSKVLGSPAPTVSAPALEGMDRGLITVTNEDGSTQDLYITSDGTVRDVTGKSEETQAGLKADTVGMFDTPEWYEDEYAEPAVEIAKDNQEAYEDAAGLMTTPKPKADDVATKNQNAYEKASQPPQQEEDNSDSRVGTPAGSGEVSDRYGNVVTDSSGQAVTYGREEDNSSSSSSSGGGWSWSDWF